MDSTLARDTGRPSRGRATSTWMATAVVVLLLAALALSTPLWLPKLLAGSPLHEFTTQRATDWLQLAFWLAAALAGAIGARRALDVGSDGATTLDASVTRMGQSSSSSDPSGDLAGQAPHSATDRAKERMLLKSSERERAADGSEYVSFYTQGGVRIRAEDGLLDEMEEAFGGQALPVEVPPLPSPAVQIPQAPSEHIDPPPSEVRPEPQPPSSSDPEPPTLPIPINPTEQPELSPPPLVAPLPPTSATPPAPAAEPVPYPTPPTPASAPLITTPFNLPADLPDFTGREYEIEQVRKRLTESPIPDRVPSSFNPEASEQTITISVLAGMGGIGKTALALHVGHQMASEGYFPDARLYLDLKGTAPRPLAPSAALKTLLTALQGPDPERPDDLDELARLWRGAMQGKHAIIILDNAAGASQVRPLLPGSATCTVLVTSRQRFALPGAQLLDLDRLSSTDSRRMLQTLAPRLDDATADEIAARCGGLPLALRIAGNYLALNDDFPADEYATRLIDARSRMANLRDPLDPDLDVAATLSLSVSQLAVGNRWAWSMLALFPAPFDSAAAAALWGEGVSPGAWVALDEKTTIAWLSALRNRSLVTYDAGTDRYRLHDLLHLAASLELVDSEEEQRAQARLAYHFLAIAREVDRRQKYLELDPDWPHLKAALEFAKDESPELLSELVLALDSYWSARGMALERAQWNEQASQANADEGNRLLMGIHMANQGSAYADRGDARRAVEVFGRALAISRTGGDQQLEGTILGHLGRAYQALGDARRAIHYDEQALEIARAIGDRASESIHLGSLGNAYAELGDPRRAVEHHSQALDMARELGDRQMEGLHLGNLGRAHADLGDAQQAITGQKEALAIHRQTGNRRGEGKSLDSLGRVYMDMGQADRAIDYYEQALEIARATSDRRGEGADLNSLGLAYTNLRDPNMAIACHEQALGIAREVGDRRTEGATLGNLGRAYLDLGQTRQAMEAYNEALEIARQVGDRRSEATWLGDLGQAHAQLGDLRQASKLQEQALAIYREIGDRRNEGNYLANLGLLARQQGDEDRAHQAWSAALRTLEAVKDPSAGRVWQWLAELEGQPTG